MVLRTPRQCHDGAGQSRPTPASGIAGARSPSRKDNLDDILEAPDRETLIEWLHFQPLAHHESGVTMVHAGIPPCGALRTHYNGPGRWRPRFRAHAASNSWQNVRQRSLRVGRSTERLDATTSDYHYLTRMRYCTRKGKLDLVSKGPKPIPDALQGKKVAPWFSHKNRAHAARESFLVTGHRWKASPMIRTRSHSTRDACGAIPLPYTTSIRASASDVSARVSAIRRRKTGFSS